MKKFATLLLGCICCVFSISAQNNCISPNNLTAALHYPNWQNVNLNWEAPNDLTTQTIALTTSTTLGTRVGLSAGPVNLTGAIRFETSSLSDFTNHYLTAVSFMPGEGSDLCTYTIKVWRGGSHGSSYNAGTLVYSKVISEELTINTLNTILLDSAVAINPGQELWIGVQCVTTSTGEAYPLCASSGTTSNNGELISLGGSWQTLTSGGVAGYTWIILGTVTESDHIVNGYNVYRNNSLLNNAPITSYSYLDNVANGAYYYGVTAVYRNGCESDPVNTYVTMGDNPCVDCMDSVFVSNGNTESYRVPTSTYSSYSYSQQIFSASEINRISGYINCLSFQYFYNTPQNRNLKIYLGNTEKNTFANYTDWEPLSSMTLVYDGTLNLNNEGPNHWLNVPLNQPFEWDGSSNLVMAVLDNTGHLTTSTNNTFYAHTATSKTLYYQSSTAPLTPETNSYSGTVASVRSNIRFMIGDSIECPLPTNIRLENITDNSADLRWEARNDNLDFVMVVVPEGSSIEYESPLYITGTSYSLEYLTDNTNYTVYLRGNCSGNDSIWRTFSFKTSCLPVAQLPYLTTFNDMGEDNLPDCWSSYTVPNSNISITNISENDTADNSLLLVSNTDASAYAILPAFDSGLPLNTLQLKFKALKTSSTYGHLEIGVMSNPYDAATFTAIKSIDATSYASNDTWYPFVTYFNNYTGNGQYIAFRTPGDYSNSVYIDDVEVNLIAGCGMPVGFKVVSTSGSAAHLAWNTNELADESVIYNIEYSIQGMENWQTVTTPNNFILLSDLEQLTTYDVRIFISCDNGSGDTLFSSFTTKCLSGGDIPIGNETNTTTYFPSYCFYNYSYTQQVYLASELNGPNDLHSISFNCATVNTPNRECKIYLMHTTENSVATSWLSADSAVLVYSGAITWTTGWNTLNFDTIFHYDGTRNLAVLFVDLTGSYSTANSFYCHNNPNGSSRYVYNDGSAYDIYNMTVTGIASTSRANVIFGGICDQVSTCVPPMVAVSNVTPHSAHLSWVPGYQETSWDLEYKIENDANWTSAGTQTSTSYDFENIASSTTYLVRMRSLCDDSTSNFANVSFTTDCDYVSSLPYMENFDSTSSSNNSIPACWNRIHTYSTPYPYVTSSSYATSGSNALYLYNGGSSYYSIGVLPRLDNDIAMDSLLITFKAHSSSTSYFMEVGIMENPSDASSFTTICTVRLSQTSLPEDVEILTRNYHGNGHYIALRAPIGYASLFYIDDIAVNYIPSCMPVGNLAVSDIDSASAHISWTPGREEYAWDVVIIPTTDSVNLDTCTINYVYDPFFDADYLNASTDYTVYVRSNCDDVTSNWRQIRFITSQPYASMPYLCTFEDPADQWILLNGTCSNKWVVDTAVNHGGSHSLYVSNDNGQHNNYTNENCYIWACRDIYMPANLDGYVFSFDWRCVGESSYDYMNVYLGNPASITAGSSLTIPDDAELLASTLNQSSSFQTFSIVLPGNSNASVKRLYFMWHNDGSVENEPAAAVDNVSLDFISCAAPVNLYAYNITPESAMINWTEIGNATSWNLYYRTTTASSWTMVANVTPPYLLNNLSEETSYTMYVKAICDENDTTTSPASFASSFTTTSSCPAPTGVTVSSITANSFIVNWNAGGEETNWTISYKPSTASTWTDVAVTTKPYTITGLAGSTTYSVRVKADCSSNDASQWVSYTGTITTLEAPCPSPYSFSADNISSHSADIQWMQESNTADSWKLAYRKMGGSWDTIFVNNTHHTFTNLLPSATYMVRIYAVCSSTSTSTVPLIGTFTTTAEADTTGIRDHNYLAQNISLYPNPMNDAIRIQSPVPVVKVEIFDILGQNIRSIIPTTNNIIITLNDKAPGLYLARITTKEGIITKRFVKK